VLGILLALQVMLGVESWMGKFAGVLLPELHRPTIGQAATRVAHVLVGSFILATSVVLTVRAYRPAAEMGTRASPPHTAIQTPALPTADRSGITPLVHQLEGTV
jgi:hypothetical protein